MNKKYTVFLSSTYDDLREERREVIQTLLELDCIPCSMETFPADNDEQFEFIKSVIDECDYYVLIIAGRYGTIGKNGMSYTEMEYRYAIDKGIPVLTFIHSDISAISFEKSEKDEQNRKKLDAFIEYASCNKLVKFWNGKEDLAAKVSTSMVSVIKRHPTNGWIKGTPILEGINSINNEDCSHLVDDLVYVANKCKEEKNFEITHRLLKWGYTLQPKKEKVLKEYGGLYYDEKKYEGALIYWKKLLDMRTCCGHYYLCAAAYDMLGNIEQAKEFCSLALKYPDDGYYGKAESLYNRLMKK